MPDLAPVIIDHPLSTLTDQEIERRAEEAAGQSVDVWLGRSAADRASPGVKGCSIDESQ